MPSTLLDKLTDYARTAPKPSASSLAHRDLYSAYENPAIICLDTALSIRNNRVRAVLPRMTAFEKDFPEINSLEKLRDMIKGIGVEAFGEVWNFRAKHRVEMALALAEWFLAYKKEHGIADDLEAIQHWAANVDVTAKHPMDVKGVGLSAVQHLRMIAGYPTVPVGDYLKVGIEELFGDKVQTPDAIVLAEQAADRADRPVWDLCSALWDIASCKA